MVTDHRLQFAWDLPSGWHSDAISFEEITGWSLGRRHDGRPMLRLEHPTHIRPERVAAHHVHRCASTGDLTWQVEYDRTLSRTSSVSSPALDGMVKIRVGSDGEVSRTVRRFG